LRLAENTIDFLVWKQYLWNKPQKRTLIVKQSLFARKHATNKLISLSHWLGLPRPLMYSL